MVWLLSGKNGHSNNSQNYLPARWCGVHPKSFDIAGKYSIVPAKIGCHAECDIRFYLDVNDLPSGSMWSGYRARAGKERAIFVKWPDFQAIPINRLENIAEYIRYLAYGKKFKVAIGCTMGHGRTGTLVAGLLIQEGVSAKNAIQQVRECLCVQCIESKEQENLLFQYERRKNFLRGIKEEDDLTLQNLSVVSSCTENFDFYDKHP